MESMVEAPVTGRVEVSGGCCILAVHSPRQAEVAQPGQFCMLSANLPALSSDPLLNRPISVLATVQDDRGRGADILFLIKDAGRGTSLILRENRPAVLCLGPYGNAFPDPSPGERVALVGGGVGVAPLFFYASKWGGTARVSLFYGGRSSRDLPLYPLLFPREPGLVLPEKPGVGPLPKMAAPRLESCVVATEDGSVGVEGLVTGPFGGRARDRAFDRVLCCGPNPMMESVFRIAGRDLPSWAALENRMACGRGICLGCAVPVAGDTGEVAMQRVCRDGPVFRSDRVAWDKLN